MGKNKMTRRRRTQEGELKRENGLKMGGKKTAQKTRSTSRLTEQTGTEVSKGSQFNKRTGNPAPGNKPIPRKAAGDTTGGNFPLVGIGASAGGLEAIEQFLKHVPKDSGMAFVIVQHLDPTHKGILVEIIQRVTGMKVMQVKDRQKVQPDCVYVIPPNKDISILHDVLHLLAPTAPRGLRLPIDFFFRSLAEDRKQLSVGVILSGLGSDGTMGIRAIKEKAGVVLVQEPASAKFDGMPRSSIDTGVVDFVAPAEKLPEKIVSYFRHVPFIVSPEPVMEDKTQSGLEKAVLLLRAKTGQDFSMYKKTTIYRRIERRMGIHKINKIGTYVRYLQENPQELEILFKELLVGVTNFFRDPVAWQQLKTKAVTALLSNWPAGKSLRAWVPGCSTGEEAYSLAIVIKETLEEVKHKGSFPIQIFATDLDREAIEKARQQFFPVNITADVSPERLKKYFIREDKGYSISNEIREMVTFAPHNLIMDPPFTKLDILTCRNLLIYLVPEIQKKLIPLFHYSLNPGGILLLGSAETIGGFNQLFTPVDVKSKIYRRTETPLQAAPVEFPTSFAARPVVTGEPMAVKPEANLQSTADQLLLRQYAPAAVLVDGNGDILYISGRTGKYLEPAVGKANWNIFAMAREGLRHELGSAFKKALRQKDAVTVQGLKVGTNGGEQFLDLTVQAIAEPETLRGTVIIVFKDVAAQQETKAAKGKKSSKTHITRIEELEQELLHAREETRTTREEMQTSQEELKSTNEELQSANEELQSTNEELTSSREELQSMNEELQTINAEQQTKVDEFTRTHNDMENLLNSTDIATVFLDNQLNIRRFTTQAAKIIKLIPGDVGRPFTDLSSALLYPDLPDDSRAVLKTLASKEKQIASRDGRWFTVRIMPYRTLDNKIEGLVITFSDITVAKKLEAELRRLQAELQKRFDEQTIILEKTDAMLQSEIGQKQLEKDAKKAQGPKETNKKKP
jgi:chemotaxis methyl-accepting protein methylase/chemotaxis response regulator CheB/PAS domain-containing protein